MGVILSVICQNSIKPFKSGYLGAQGSEVQRDAPPQLSGSAISKSYRGDNTATTFFIFFSQSFTQIINGHHRSHTWGPLNGKVPLQSPAPSYPLHICLTFIIRKEISYCLSYGSLHIQICSVVQAYLLSNDLLHRFVRWYYQSLLSIQFCYWIYNDTNLFTSTFLALFWTNGSFRRS